MPRSMTGFGRSTVASPTGVFEVEIRATNGKHLDVGVRLPPHLAAFEGKIRETVAGRVSRGRLLVGVSHRPGEGGARVEVNAPLLHALVETLGRAGREAGIDAPPRWSDLLQIPGLVDVRLAPDDPEAAWDSLRRAVVEALDALDGEREREGASAAEACRRHLGEVAAALDEARARAADVPAAARVAIERRIAALAPEGAVDPGRIAAEVALLASRADIQEEIDRVAAHLKAAGALLARSGPAGAELSFLAQELLREWTTTAAKSPDSAVAAASIRARAAIERVREQAANLE